MTIQDTFWPEDDGEEPSRHSRRNDPDTSQQAGKRHDTDVGRFRGGTHKARLLEVLLGGDKFTAQEAALRVVHSHLSAIEGCRRRVHELAEVGFIVDTQERKVNPGAATPAILWQITERGKMAWAHLQQTGWSK
jgi:hypothetical protein